MEDATPVIRNGRTGKVPVSSTEYGTAKSLTVQDKVFHYDAVFSQEATQKEVYERSVGDAVRRNIFRGYNTTIIAYGQTGSGKTYTMGGKHESELANRAAAEVSPTAGRNSSSISRRNLMTTNQYNSSKSVTSVPEKEKESSASTFAVDEDDGIIPRAVHDLFKAKQRHESAGEVSIQLTYLEIYNDELRDLLVDGGDSPASMKLCDHGDDGVVVKGLTSATVTSTEEVKQLMESAAKRRTTASTRMNMRSSRSHSICSLLVTIIPATKSRSIEDVNASEEVISAKLTLVDLAGSERLKETGVAGIHQQESININKDLFVLGKVVSALADKSKTSRTKGHVPYRDSKLTRLLRDSLGGNCCTVMVACVSPSQRNVDESVNTLRYAERASTITNAVKQNVIKAVMTPAECAAMRGENKMLKSKVQELAKRVRLLEQKVDDVDALSVVSTLTMDDLSLGASVEDSFAKTTEAARTESAPNVQAAGDLKSLTLTSLDLEIKTKKETVEKLRLEAAVLESKLTLLKRETTLSQDSMTAPHRNATAAPGTNIEMVTISNVVGNCAMHSAALEEQRRKHAQAVRILEEKVQGLCSVNAGLRQEITLQTHQIESLQVVAKDNDERVDALALQLGFEQKRLVEHEDILARTKQELGAVVEARDGYRMKLAIQTDELAKREQELAVMEKQLDEINRLRLALSLSKKENDILVKAAEEKENECSAHSTALKEVDAFEPKSVLAVRSGNVEDVHREKTTPTKRGSPVKHIPVQEQACERSFDTNGQDSEGSHHNAIRLQAAKMLFFANKAIERSREARSVCSSLASSNGSEFRPPMANIRSLVNESGSTQRSAPAATIPAGKPTTPGRPPRATRRSPTKLPRSQDEGPVISNLEQLGSMNGCMCSNNPEYVDFYLPKLGASCSCGKQDAKDISFLEGVDPYSLENILRDWQVAFLASVKIHTAQELVAAYSKKAGILAKQMRKWRTKQKLVSIKTASCGIALHIWTRTCKAVIKSIEKQLKDGVKAIKRPAILEVSWTSDNNTAVSSLGSSLAEF